MRIPNYRIMVAAKHKPLLLELGACVGHSCHQAYVWMEGKKDQLQSILARHNLETNGALEKVPTFQQPVGWDREYR